MTVATYRTYLRRIYDIIEEVLQTQGREIETAADWMADTIANRGVVHLFGSGHSHMVAEEVFHRAFKHREFDVCELSFSSYLRTVDWGDAPYVGIPAFVPEV